MSAGGGGGHSTSRPQQRQGSGSLEGGGRAARPAPASFSHPLNIAPTPPTATPSRYGTFTAHAYRSLLDGGEHLALVHGRVRHGEGVLARVHSESMLGDLFGAERCDSGSQLDAALGAIVARGAGVLVYLRGQQGRGLGLAEELEGYASAAQAEACGSPAALEDGAFPVRGRWRWRRLLLGGALLCPLP